MDTALPQVFCAPELRTVVVCDHLVMLDLRAGEYLVLDEVGTAMWQWLLAPDAHDLTAMSAAFEVPAAVFATDAAQFGREQIDAGRLLLQPRAERSESVAAPLKQPSVARAWRERALADRYLHRGFAGAYRRTTTLVPDDTMRPERAPLRGVIRAFVTALNLYPAHAAPLDCLPRSLALTRLLRVCGWPAQHVIGVAMYPFEAHAWVEVKGVPILEGSTYVRRFTVIQRA